MTVACFSKDRIPLKQRALLKTIIEVAAKFKLFMSTPVTRL